MRRIDHALQNVTQDHRRESYAGPLASTSGGGHKANINNLYKSQVRDALTVMPYGISSRSLSGVKAQTIVNDNNDHIMVGIYDPSRPAVSAGEICIYSCANASVYLNSGGDVSVETSGANADFKKSGAINIYNTAKGSIGIDAAGNIGISTSEGYSIIVGLYADESADGGEEQVNGITMLINDIKVTFDGETGEIKIAKEETAAVITVTEDNDITMVSQELCGVEIKHDENVKMYNSQSSVTVKNDGKVMIDAANNIEFNCSEFKVNGQTMIVP
ncbi:MAG: hypothetical protein NC247_01915 [Ruminococcus flavefaciens]|nr:hypothetical protein [Ruminococcus flavefaciens]